MKAGEAMENNERRKEVLNICLDTFISTGLTETSVRDLSASLNLHSGGIYYWFKDKDELVVACADEAAIRLENSLIAPAFLDLSEPENFIDRLLKRADEMAPTMQFLVSVCSAKKYQEKLKPALDRLAERYSHYAVKVASVLKCDKSEIEPYLYMTITAVMNYMVFRERSYIIVQLSLVKNAVEKLLER